MEAVLMKYEIGARIRKYREAQQMSQKELAERIGVSNGRVSNWEQGINRPDVDILADICATLNVSPSELLDIRLSIDELNSRERKIISQYRKKPELQRAVNILLGVNADDTE
jgi:transcriptional regulator with XRE-family HTH domain